MSVLRFGAVAPLSMQCAMRFTVSALTDGDLNQTTELSMERVKKCLADHGYHFLDDDTRDDVLAAGFHDYRFHFILTGEGHQTLQVRGRWNHSLDVARKVEMVKVCNETNINRIFPKAFVRRESEDRLSLYGEYSADFCAGATDAQIDRAISAGLKSIISFFRDIESRFGAEIAAD